MRDPIPSAQRAARRELRRLRGIKDRLWRRSGHLAHAVEQGGPHARLVAALCADLECLLTDHLAPAADALERLGLQRPIPLPLDPEEGREEGPSS